MNVCPKIVRFPASVCVYVNISKRISDQNNQTQNFCFNHLYQQTILEPYFVMCEDGFLTLYCTKFHLYSINGFEPPNIYLEIERGTEKYSLMTHVHVNSACLDPTKHAQRVS